VVEWVTGRRRRPRLKQAVNATAVQQNPVRPSSVGRSKEDAATAHPLEEGAGAAPPIPPVAADPTPPPPYAPLAPEEPPLFDAPAAPATPGPLPAETQLSPEQTMPAGQAPLSASPSQSSSKKLQVSTAGGPGRQSAGSQEGL
jgi:hypothetical protein